MSNAAAVCVDVIAPLERGLGKLAGLSDQELLASTRRLIGATNQILAELLTHLAEVEKRGIHRARLCTSLYTYCIYELRLSEDAAYRRVCAARLVQRFPALYDAIASGELHLTGLLMLGPHLTPESIADVLPRAKHRTKKELAQLVRQLDPLPDVPSFIQPLGPVPVTLLPPKLRNPTWAEYARSLNPINHLLPGQRPREWMSDTPFSLLSPVGESEEVKPPPAPARAASSSTLEQPAAARVVAPQSEPEHAELAPLTARARRAPLEPFRSPQRYQVQFTAGQEYVELVERAKALLSHTSNSGLAELHLRAMRTLVSELEKRKYALRRGAAPTRDVDCHGGDGATGLSDENGAEGANADETHAAETDTEGTRAGAAHEPTLEASSRHGADPPGASAKLRQRGRYIPATVRRAVVARDGQRCTYRDEQGRRCAERHRLEFHHLVPFARGGEHAADNIMLRCRCHNQLAAEEDFGQLHMGQARAQPHESLVRQAGPGGTRLGAAHWHEAAPSVPTTRRS